MENYENPKCSTSFQKCDHKQIPSSHHQCNQIDGPSFVLKLKPNSPVPSRKDSQSNLPTLTTKFISESNFEKSRHKSLRKGFILKAIPFIHTLLILYSLLKTVSFLLHSIQYTPIKTLYHSILSHEHKFFLSKLNQTEPILKVSKRLSQSKLSSQIAPIRNNAFKQLAHSLSLFSPLLILLSLIYSLCSSLTFFSHNISKRLTYSFFHFTVRNTALKTLTQLLFHFLKRNNAFKGLSQSKLFFTTPFFLLLSLLSPISSHPSSLTLYSLPLYHGDYLRLPTPLGCYNLPPGWNDRVESVTSQGCVQLYTEPGCTGRSLRVSKIKTPKKIKLTNTLIKEINLKSAK